MKRFREILDRIKSALSNYKYPVIILLAGLVLVLFPTRKSNAGATPAASAPTEAANTSAPPSNQKYCEQTERELEQILSQIQGAGTVRVMLTLEAGPETVYLSDSDIQRSAEGGRTSEKNESKTVILSRGSSYNEAAIVKTEYPSFRGALIVSQGADDASVRLRLTEAVSALLGLGSDKITVVKMK